MKHYVDLTHPIHEGMITAPAPWHPVVEITQLGRHCLEGRESYRLVIGSHTGTHTDTPAHMVENGSPRIDALPLDLLIGPAKLLRIPKEPLSRITIDDIRGTGVPIEPQDRLVINTGWYKRWGTKQFFAQYPCIDIQAAKWLVENGIRYIGMDMPSPDDPRDKLQPGQPNPLHYEFLSHGVIMTEYLTNLDSINRVNFELIILPLLVKGFDGSPTRAIAVLEE